MVIEHDLTSEKMIKLDLNKKHMKKYVKNDVADKNRFNREEFGDWTSQHGVSCGYQNTAYDLASGWRTDILCQRKHWWKQE